MGRCQFSLRARRDLHEINDYISRDSHTAAERFVDLIENTCRTLATHPAMGQSCEQLAANLRLFTVGNYVIFYRPIDNGVEIVRVVGGARDIDVLF